MSRPRVPGAAVLALVSVAAVAAAPSAGRAQEAPADSAMHAWMRSMTDSTDAYFGVAAEPPDTAGLDSALEAGLALPPGATLRSRPRLTFGPLFEFNRAIAAAYGGWTSVALGPARLNGSLQWANGPDDWYGSGGLSFEGGDGDLRPGWSFRADAGRRFDPLDRDHYSPFFTLLDAFVYGTDRHSYLRRDGVRAGARLTAGDRWLAAGYRNELESPLATTATWTLTRRALDLVPNAPAALGRASEVRLGAGARVPGTPFSVDGTMWNAGGALGGDLAYHRYRAALAGGIGLGRHVAFTPQLEYARLTGAALPQDALYLGGSHSLITVDPRSLAGTGRTVAHAEVFLLDDLFEVLRLRRNSAFPIQVGAFGATAARWGYDPATGAPRLTARDWPGREQWMSEAGVSVMYRPGLPRPDSFLRLDVAWPLGPNDRSAKVSLSWRRTLYLLGGQ